MKKIITLLSILLICVAFCGCEKETGSEQAVSSVPPITTGESKVIESLSEKLISEIDGAYQKDARLPEYSTTAGMVELADKYTDKWKQVAEEYYAKIMEYKGDVQLSVTDYSPEDFHTFVSNMKTNWEEYSQKQCENYLKTQRYIYDSGTIVGPIMAHYKYELQKDWALEIVGLCEHLCIM